MPHPFEATVHDTPQEVFDRLADVRSYGDWLPRKGAYKGTQEVSAGPIAVGTTYVETDPMGTRHGRIAVLEAPTLLVFSQPMTMRPSLLGEIGIEVRYDLTPHDDHVHVRRTVDFAPGGPVKVAWPLVKRGFLAENRRIMRELEALGHAAR